MSNYIPHHTKKRKSLARHTGTLRQLICKKASREKLIAAAEKVRNARIGVLRAQRATISPVGGAKTELESFDAKIQQIIDMPVDVILAEFGDRADQPN